MTISFPEYFENNEAFSFRHGLFYQNDLPVKTDFEREYIDLRNKEERFYSDAMVNQLPDLPKKSPHYEEWRIRKTSAQRLISYLKKKRIRNIVEVGCGNGWLTNYLFKSLQVDCCGIDINETELKQAANVFSPNNEIIFAHADILSPVFKNVFADIIVMASVIQYFPEPEILLAKLQSLLTPEGEIHVLDSPFYRGEDIVFARERSLQYFNESGNTGMQTYYHHHSWKCIENFNHEILYNPESITGKARRFFLKDTPFPWIKVVL